MSAVNIFLTKKKQEYMGTPVGKNFSIPSQIKLKIKVVQIRHRYGPSQDIA
jgi:hypothetical protein